MEQSRFHIAEPNLVSHTAHSLARKGIKSKDLDDSQLREAASQVLPHVRQSHLLADAAESVISGAIKRGLIGGNSGLNKEMASSEPLLTQNSQSYRRRAWVPPVKANSRYEIPRAYMPFYEVARVSSPSPSSSP